MTGVNVSSDVPLQTPRLVLLPLTRELLSRTLEASEAPAFQAQGFTFTAGWAGEAEIFFPLHLGSLGRAAAVRGSFAVVERASGRGAGLLGTKHVPSRGRVEIGYGLTGDMRGRGYATEALGALLEHLSSWPEVRTVVAETLPDNHASIRVLENNGFVLTGRTGGKEGERLRWARPLHRPAPPAE